MKIAIIIPNNFNIGLFEYSKAIEYFIKQALLHNHKIVLFTPDKTPTKQKVKQIKCKTLKKLYSKRLDTAFIDNKNSLYKFLDKKLGGFDKVIVEDAYFFHENAPLILALRDLAKKHEFKIFHWILEYRKNWFDSGQIWKLLNKPSKKEFFIFISGSRRKEILGLTRIKCKNEVIGCAFDFEYDLGFSKDFVRIYEKHNLSGYDPIIFLPGRLRDNNRLELALETISRIKKIKRPLLVLTIIKSNYPANQNEYYARIKLLIKKNKIEKKVLILSEEKRFEKGIPSTLVNDFYKFSDVILFPSNWEGFGLPILEAMVQKTPLLSSTFKENELPTQIAKKLLKIANNPQKKLFKIALKSFESEVIFKKVEKVLSK